MFTEALLSVNLGQKAYLPRESLQQLINMGYTHWLAHRRVYKGANIFGLSEYERFIEALSLLTAMSRIYTQRQTAATLREVAEIGELLVGEDLLEKLKAEYRGDLGSRMQEIIRSRLAGQYSSGLTAISRMFSSF